MIMSNFLRDSARVENICSELVRVHRRISFLLRREEANLEREDIPRSLVQTLIADRFEVESLETRAAVLREKLYEASRELSQSVQ